MNDFNEMHALYHYGIKGQKWGVRRYQNPDGTLTAEGKARYGANDFDHMTEANKQKYQDDLDRGVRNNLESAGGIASSVKAGTESARQIPTSSGHVDRGTYPNMTDKELQDKINRMTLEQRYSDLKGDTKYVKSGGEKAKEVLQTVGAVAGIGVTIATLAQIFYGMRHPKKGKH